MEVSVLEISMAFYFAFYGLFNPPVLVLVLFRDPASYQDLVLCQGPVLEFHLGFLHPDLLYQKSLLPDLWLQLGYPDDNYIW